MKLLTFFIFVFLGVFITFPWVFHLTDYVTGYGDNFIYAWIHTWAIQSLINGNLSNIFTTNIFYPFQIGPGASDPNLATAYISLIPYLITKEPIVTVNFITILSIILTGFSIFLLSHYITKDYPASVLAGILVIFSPAYLSFYAHIQMLFIVFVPLSILYFLKYLKSRKTKHLVISLTFFLIQTYNNFLGGYFILFSYAIIFFFSYLANKKNTLSFISRKNIAVFIIFLALIIPAILPYFKVSKEFNYVRDIKDTVHFALQPEDLLYASEFSRFNPVLNNLPINKVSQNNEFKPGYLGLVFTVLIILSFIYALKNLRRKNFELNSFLIISFLGLILSLGPVLHLGRQTVHWPSIIPLPYTLFYYLIPGFQGFRNSARWEMLFIVGSAVVVSTILAKLMAKQNLSKKIIIYGVLILGCIIELNYPMKFVTIPGIKDFPEEHKWLSTQSSNVKYVEMPIYNWDMTDYATIELWRMYFSSIHFRRTMNGGGGFTPPTWQKMAYELDENFPNQLSISRLNDLGINYLIVHKDEFDRLDNDKFVINGKRISDGTEVISELNKNEKLRLIENFGQSYIYEFTN